LFAKYDKIVPGVYEDISLIFDDMPQFMDYIKNDTKSVMTSKKGAKEKSYETVLKGAASKLASAEIVNPILNNYPGFSQDEAMAKKRRMLQSLLMRTSAIC
jgi:hypothetical protein